MVATMWRLMAALCCFGSMLWFAFLTMLLSGGIAAWPGVWVMNLTENVLVILVGLLIAFVMGLGSAGLCMFCALASMAGCSGFLKSMRGAPIPSIRQCFLEAIYCLEASQTR